jgi:hypothetical protein
VLADRIDLVGHQSMSLAVHGIRRLGIWSFDQAEDLAGLFVHPVPQILDSVRILVRKVGLMRFGHVVGPDSPFDRVNIHEDRHFCPSRDQVEPGGSNVDVFSEGDGRLTGRLTAPNLGAESRPYAKTMAFGARHSGLMPPGGIADLE